VLAVEWSENILAAIPGNAWRVNISPGEGENSRVITIAKPKLEAVVLIEDSCEEGRA